MNPMFSALLVIGMTTFLGTQAQAQAVVEKDWVQEKRIHELNSVTSCVASTSKAESTLPVKTEIILPENDEKVPLLVIKAKGLNGAVPRAHVRPDAKTQYPMLLLKSDATTGEDTFVLSPMRTPETLQIIAAKNTLDIYFGEGPTAILARVSLKGSSKTIERAKACRPSKVLWKERLFKELKADPQLATALVGTVQDMLNAYQETLNFINASDLKQAALNAHIQAGQPILNQEKQAQQAVVSAEKAVLDTQNQISLLQKRIADLKNAIAQAQIDLPQLQSERPVALQAVQNAKNALSSVEVEIRRLQNEIDIAQARESQIQASINTIQSQISSIQNQIYALDDQVARLRQDQNWRYNEVNKLQNQKAQLEHNYKMFDVNRRAEEILRNNPHYGFALDNLREVTNYKNQLQNDITAASNLVKELTRALKDCKAAGTTDCSDIEARLQSAQSDLNQKQLEMKEVDRKINDINVSLRNMEAAARQQAINERDQMVNAINKVQQDIRKIENDIAIVDRQINDIQKIDIPRLQNEMSSKKSDLAIAQSSLAQASADVRRAQANLENYKKSVGYDKLVNNLNSAQARLNAIDKGIAQAQKTLKDGPGQITANEAELLKQQNLLIERQAALAQAKVRLSDAQAAVAVHQTAEQDIRNQLAVILGDLLKAKRNTQGLSKALYGY